MLRLRLIEFLYWNLWNYCTLICVQFINHVMFLANSVNDDVITIRKKSNYCEKHVLDICPSVNYIFTLPWHSKNNTLPTLPAISFRFFTNFGAGPYGMRLKNTQNSIGNLTTEMRLFIAVWGFKVFSTRVQAYFTVKNRFLLETIIWINHHFWAACV